MAFKTFFSTQPRFHVEQTHVRIKPPVTHLATIFEAGDSDILKENHNTVILSPVSRFYSNCPSNAIFLRIATGAHDENVSFSASSTTNSSSSDGKQNVRLSKQNLKHFK